MTLAQMRTLLPLVEEVAKELPPALSNPHIKEGEPVLDNLTPFSAKARTQMFVWVLDYSGRIIHEYRQVAR